MTKKTEELAKELHDAFYGGNPSTQFEERDCDAIAFWIRLTTHVEKLIRDARIEAYKEGLAFRHFEMTKEDTENKFKERLATLQAEGEIVRIVVRMRILSH